MLPDSRYLVLENLYADLKDKVEFIFDTPVDSVKIIPGGYEIKAKDVAYSCKKCIVSVGRSGSKWMEKVCKDLSIPTSSNRVDLGVRVELPATVFAHLTDELYESKIVYRTKQYGDKVRTFCMNPKGAVVNENTNGIITVNGHSYEDPARQTENTNFALLVAKHFSEPFKEMKNSNGDPMMMYDWRCGFDAETADIENEISADLNAMFRSIYRENNEAFYSFSIQSREAMRESFYDVYGSLFFLGIMLSIVFLLAAVLIIYYKQISEGYEDHGRFEIMQKVGMTKRGIRKSINSQMITVFFMPLIFAGIHLVFAFPFLSKILVMFAMDNLLLTAIVNLICFAVFGLFYALVYKITSSSYYTIVSGSKE